MRFAKGHGTENDFVLLPDVDDRLELDAELVRRLCDRRAGLGADGVLRIAPARDADEDWFMDYRNADGSVAEMCGNGIRVFARYLVDNGLASAGALRIGTRAGVRAVDVGPDGEISADMGPALRGQDASVVVGDATYAGAGWSFGNPHLVVTLPDVDALERLDLTAAPAIEPMSAYPAGVNVEFVVPLGPQHIRMRVHERGSGETRSCGTGACAAAVAVMAERGERASCDVDVPGGRLRVSWGPDGDVRLAGPAVIVATGEIAPTSAPVAAGTR